MATKNTEMKQFKKYSVSRYYTDNAFNVIYDIFCTYRSRGGIMTFYYFAWIPLKCNPGDLEDEQGIWPKYIRNKLAHDWDNIMKGIY